MIFVLTSDPFRGHDVVEFKDHEIDAAVAYCDMHAEDAKQALKLGEQVICTVIDSVHGPVFSQRHEFTYNGTKWECTILFDIRDKTYFQAD